jgi:hypothetical protein
MPEAGGINRRSVEGMQALATGGTALAVLLATGCGGTRQDANEPSGTFPLRVSAASFPARQRLSREAVMKVTVVNTGTKAVPNVAVTVYRTGSANEKTRAAAFSETSKQPDLASTSRPIWIVDKGPYGGDTAYANTWALGTLAPHRSRTFSWHVSPTRAGKYGVSYEVAAGLNGKARASGPGGGVPRGSFTVAVSGTPSQGSVDANGNVVNSGG